MRSDMTWCIVAGNIARLWEVAGQDVVDGVNSGAQTSCQPDQDQKPAVDSLIDWETPDLFFLSLFKISAFSVPLFPFLILGTSIHEFDVEQRREDECEKRHCGGSDQVEDGSKWRNSLGNKQKQEDRHCSEHTPLPVKMRGNIKEVLQDLRWGVHDDREGGDQVQEQHHLHSDPLPAPGHGQHDVVGDEARPQGEVAGDSHREVDEEQD